MATTATNLLSTKLQGAFVGTLGGFSEAGQPLVSFTAAPTPLIEARSCVKLAAEHVGAGVVMVLENNRLDRPIIIGAVLPPADSDVMRRGGPGVPVTARVDGTRVVLSAESEIVLECGKASITLTRAGKILIRGAYVSSHSQGVNRIKGGSVEIN